MTKVTIVLYIFFRQNVDANDNYVTEDLIKCDAPGGIVDTSWKKCLIKGARLKELSNLVQMIADIRLRKIAMDSADTNEEGAVP